MLRETPVEMWGLQSLKAMLHSLQRPFALVCFVVLIYYIFMFVLVKSIYLCMTWECYWERAVVAFVAEATMFGFGKNRV